MGASISFETHNKLMGYPMIIGQQLLENKPTQEVTFPKNDIHTNSIHVIIYDPELVIFQSDGILSMFRLNELLVDLEILKLHGRYSVDQMRYLIVGMYPDWRMLSMFLIPILNHREIMERICRVFELDIANSDLQSDRKKIIEMLYGIRFIQIPTQQMTPVKETLMRGLIPKILSSNRLKYNNLPVFPRSGCRNNDFIFWSTSLDTYAYKQSHKSIN
jgi:hypothetical protein